MPTIRTYLQLVLACCWLALGLLVCPEAMAEDFFRVAPGPLNQSHAAYDNSEGCPRCHVSGKGVKNQNCLSCHANLNHRHGLHPTFGNRACISCHVEHRGVNYSIIDWSKVGGRETFNHDVVGFPLANHHAQVACTKCHVARLRSGRTSYLGLSTDCQSCHGGIHKLSHSELASRCDSCHPPGQVLKGMRLSAWFGPHAKYSSVSLVGKHTEQLCTKCHPNAEMPGRSPPRGCKDCHVPNHPVTAKTATCQRCHAEDSTFGTAKVDHDKFGFRLDGKHATTGCLGCHKKGEGARTGGVRTCADCHVATHPITKATANCAGCHASGKTWKGATVDHASFGLPLLGRHKTRKCGDCHSRANQNLKYTEGACARCHTHKKVHRGQFADKPCATCHIEGGKRSTAFDHDKDTKFPLVGYHAEPAVKTRCAACHPGGIYRTGKTGCDACHKDKHQGRLGRDCERCHSPTLHFNAPRSKEIAHEKFPLVGKHKTIACSSCHKNDQYRLGPKACVDCHQKDDVHQGKLGKDCGKCHRPEKGAPKFAHDTMTPFTRDGAHRRVACATCHQARKPGAPSPTVSEWKLRVSPPLDRRFPVYGRSCQDCHADPHRGTLGTDCVRCHQTGDFHRISSMGARAVKPRDHKAGWVRFHATLPTEEINPKTGKVPCSGCHGSPSCQNCHRQKAPKSHSALFRTRTHGRAASFDSTSCRTCHSTASCTSCHRHTAPLSHRGAWPTRHGYAAGGFGDSNCYVCHRRGDCAVCHRSH